MWATEILWFTGCICDRGRHFVGKSKYINWSKHTARTTTAVLKKLWGLGFYSDAQSCSNGTKGRQKKSPGEWNDRNRSARNWIENNFEKSRSDHPEHNPPTCGHTSDCVVQTTTGLNPPHAVCRSPNDRRTACGEFNPAMERPSEALPSFGMHRIRHYPISSFSCFCSRCVVLCSLLARAHSTVSIHPHIPRRREGSTGSWFVSRACLPLLARLFTVLLLLLLLSATAPQKLSERGEAFRTKEHY